MSCAQAIQKKNVGKGDKVTKDEASMTIPAKELSVYSDDRYREMCCEVEKGIFANANQLRKPE